MVKVKNSFSHACHNEAFNKATWHILKIQSNMPFLQLEEKARHVQNQKSIPPRNKNKIRR